MVASCRRSVLWLIDVVSEPNFSSSFSSNYFMIRVRNFSVMRGLGLGTFSIAWTFSARASRVEAWASRIAVVLGSDPSILPWCGIKSMSRPRIIVDLWIHSVYNAVFKHCM